MKELIKKRWFLVTLGILGIIGILAIVAIGFWGVLYLKGFRFVYPEQFENSWNAVSGIAAWAGVVVSALSAVASFLAIVFAVRVADKQNKISMFEKRYKIYETFNRFKDFSRELKSRKSDKDILQIYLKCFHDVIDENKRGDDAFFMEHCISMCNKLRYDYLLFKNTEISVYTHKLVCGLLDVIEAVVEQRSLSDDQKDPSSINKAIDAFYRLVYSEEYEKTLRRMEEELMLK